jgi:hypothetical protein
MDTYLTTKGDTIMWSIWDKTSAINGYPAVYYFEIYPHLVGEKTIFIRTTNGRVTNIEGKSILANLYGIDPTLPDDEFIAEYERMTAEPDEPAEGESATYDELTQVYREGVNSLDE